MEVFSKISSQMDDLNTNIETITKRVDDMDTAKENTLKAITSISVVLEETSAAVTDVLAAVNEQEALFFRKNLRYNEKNRGFSLYLKGNMLEYVY